RRGGGRPAGAKAGLRPREHRHRDRRGRRRRAPRGAAPARRLRARLAVRARPGTRRVPPRSGPAPPAGARDRRPRAAIGRTSPGLGLSPSLAPRSDFPELEETTYLDTASDGIVPLPVREAATRFLREAAVGRPEAG